MSAETTLIILKPDAVQRGLMGEIITRFEKKGLQLVGAKFMQIDAELAATHYESHQGKPFYEGLVALPESMGDLVVEGELKLYHNELTSLPDGFCGISDLVLQPAHLATRCLWGHLSRWGGALVRKPHRRAPRRAEAAVRGGGHRMAVLVRLRVHGILVRKASPRTLY